MHPPVYTCCGAAAKTAGYLMLLPPNPLRLRSEYPRVPGAIHSPRCSPGPSSLGAPPPREGAGHVAMG